MQGHRSHLANKGCRRHGNRIHRRRRTILPNFIDLGAGKIGGLTLVPGLYKWNTGVLISTNVTISGGLNDIWIFQIARTLTQANATKVILKGGARAEFEPHKGLGAFVHEPR
jgi:hypothetical protein